MKKSDKNAIVKKDLTTRERVNVVLDSERITAVREFSSKTNIPISRLMDEAIDLLREKREF